MFEKDNKYSNVLKVRVGQREESNDSGKKSYFNHPKIAKRHNRHLNSNDFNTASTKETKDIAVN